MTVRTQDSEGAGTFPFARDPWWTKALVWVAILLPLFGVGYAIYSLWGNHATGLDLALMLTGWTIGGLGITLGYHRLLAHKSFSAPAPVRLGLLLMGAIAVQGKPSEWAATHVRHHARADREGDPHSPIEGLLHAHMAWLVRNRFVRSGKVHERIREDPAVRIGDALWGPVVLFSLAFPALIGWWVTGTLFGALQAFAWGTGVRLFVTHHLTWCVNSLGHVIGTRPFDTVDKSRNNGLLALLTWGEGWHNNHHAAPKASIMAARWYQVDIGGIVLRMLAWMGLARDLASTRRWVRTGHAESRGDDPTPA